MIVEYFLALGMAMLSSAVTVYFRDLEHILGIITMVWMYMTPIFYSIDMIPEKLRFVYHINPMSSVISCYRDVVLRSGAGSDQSAGGSRAGSPVPGAGYAGVRKIEKGLCGGIVMAAESKQENAIIVDHVKKHFKVFLDKGQSFKERLLFRNRRRYENRQVLRDISFTVKRGEAVGLIGHNGCGKSTTLKLLTRILYPDSGTITIKGRVSSLIELGAGFHPDMSGRENIYTNASIFGLSKKEIDSRLQTIIDFSELEQFIDNPVRTYSSGMYMRLAFSVAINVDADVLLIDEILGVGDVNFQAKCFQKLQEIKAEGTTIGDRVPL